MKNRILIIFFISTYLGAQTSGRFEQSVFYSIDAQLNTSDNIVFGKERVVYTNHSPDTLRVIYFHQYANAFRKNSNMQAYQLARNGWSYMNYLPKKYLGGMRISNVRDDAGVALPTKEDDTIFEIHLIKALAPGESISLSMEFELTIPVLMRRMGHDNREGIDYSMAQWYPKVCVYDENGWHKNYYLAREFYGEFATWDVSITLPAHYTVGGSGSLTNATSIDSMIVKDPWSTFSDRVFPESARVDSFFPLRTWRYHAERIHDFAWCADPEYLVESFESQGTRINLLYLPDVKARWQKMKIWTSEILRYMNEHVGKYPYPEFTIAQGGDGGMEYPSIVFITGRRGEFSLATVTTHEMVHNWFYGLIANDESREAWMDEGITSYYTTRLAEHFFGRNASVSYETPFQQKYYPKKDAREETLTDYLWWAKQGFEEKVLTESDFFKSDQSYAMATYYKGQVFMWTLEYLYGRDRTDSLIRNFFLEHNRHHTHTDDLKRSLEKQTGAELEWLFDAWFNSLATCDYAIENYHTKKVDSKFVTQISFFRKGDLELPVDFFVRLKNDSLFGFRIPAHGDDPDKQGLMRLPLWNKTDRKYYAYISFSSDVKSIEIDTSLLMPDIHRGNNTSGFPKTDWRWQMPVAAIPTLDRYTIEHRPSMWYNRIDAADIGYRFEGVFGKDERRTNAALYYGTKSGEVDYELSYSTPWYSLGRQTAGYVKSFHSDGIYGLDYGVTKNVLESLNDAPRHVFSAGVQSRNVKRNGFLPYGFAFDTGWTNTIEAAWKYRAKKNPGVSEWRYENSTFGSEFRFQKISAAYKLPWQISTSWISEWRIFAGMIDGKAPLQKQFYLAGASPEKVFEQPFYHAWSGSTPLSKQNGARHLYYDGDASISGYNNGNPFGKKIVSVNWNLEFPSVFRLIKFVPTIQSISTYVFTDAGFISGIHEAVFDGGGGLKYPVSWFPSMIGNYTLVSEFPVWVSRPSVNNTTKKWTFRWTLGLYREL